MGIFQYSMKTSNSYLSLPFMIFLFVSQLTGCASSPEKPQLKSQKEHVFYPPELNKPRIQFLTSFSAAKDVEQGKTSMAKFVLGDQGESERALTKPYGVALFDGALYVVDTRGGGYAIFDLKNQDFRSVTGMQKPINISIGADGTKYVTDTKMRRILVFDNADKLVDVYGEDADFKPSDVAIIGDKLFVTDLKNNQIQVLDKRTGKLDYSIAKAGSKEGELIFPTNITVGPDNNLYVTDTANFRVQVLTPEGKYIRAIGDLGMELGRFARPKGVAVDRAGRVHVVDAAFQNVQLFNSKGELLMFYAAPGVGPGQLYLPTDIAIDYDHIDYFQSYAAPGFKLDYIILVSNQFGPNKVNVYGFGKMEDEALKEWMLREKKTMEEVAKEKAKQEQEIEEKATRDQVIQDDQDYQELR